VRFSCQPGCTKCCRVSGYVYLTEEDLVRAASFVGMTVEAFEARYVIRFRKVLRLRRSALSECHFLTDEGCSIHPAKPTQCRLYPFWPELVESREAWKAESRACPGIGKGELIQIGTACELAHGMVRAYPTVYGSE
jgi:uncharacterized protein